MADYVDALASSASRFPDPPPQPGLTSDPGDDDLVALARAAQAGVLVSGDDHLVGLANPRPPVMTPRAFVDALSPFT
jgi:predicted nucleic acid-binding protein